MDIEKLIGWLLGLDKPALSGRDWHFDWNNMPRAWVLLFILIVIILLSSIVYLKNRLAAAGVRRLFLIAFRFCALFTLLLLIFEPVVLIEVVEEKKSTVLFLVDNSQSMNRVDEYPEESQISALKKVMKQETYQETSRIDIAKAALSNALRGPLKELGEKWLIKFYSFGSALREVSQDGISDMRATDEETAIGDAISDALKKSRGELISTVVLVSDGQNNRGKDPINSVAENKEIQCITVVPGVKKPAYDLAITESELPEVSYTGDNVVANLRLESAGYDSGSARLTAYVRKLDDEVSDIRLVPVELEKLSMTSEKAGDIVVDISEMKARPTRSITLNFDEEGRYLALFMLEKKKGEVTYLNNYALKRINVLDNRVKVLLVDYRPRLEYLYLKAAIQRDKSVLFHPLLLDADYDFPQEHSDPRIFSAEDRRKYEKFFRPLTQLPTSMDTLLDYDVVIIGDVSLSEIAGGDEQELSTNLARFVNEFGGSVVFLAGPRGNPERTAGSRLEDILPVVPVEGYDQPYVVSDELLFSLSDDGAKSPVLKVSQDEAENKAIWEGADSLLGIRPVRWVKKVAGIKPVTVTFLYAVDRISQEKIPLISWHYYGRGRTVYIGSDDLWYSLRYFKGDGPFYYVFWRQLIQWCREGKLHGSKRNFILLDNPTREYKFGEKVSIEVRAYDADYRPMTNDTIILEVQTHSEGTRQIELVKKQDGFFYGEFLPSSPGDYRLSLIETGDATVTETFSVVYLNKEDINPSINYNLLMALADRSSEGAMFDITQLDEIPKVVKKSRFSQVRRVEDDVWDSPLFFILLALFLTMEWLLRRRLNLA